MRLLQNLSGGKGLPPSSPDLNGILEGRNPLRPFTTGVLQEPPEYKESCIFCA